MSIRKVSFAPGEYYHIYNRGNSKQKIFHDRADYERFVGLLYACNNKENFKIFNIPKGQDLFSVDRAEVLVDIGAYILMPNHFHLLIKEREERGISRFMQKFSTAYVMYHNKKYERTGGLFEGKFKSQHLGNDRYLKYIFSYIHLNCLKLVYKNWREEGIKNKKEAREYVLNYKYSSCMDFLGIKRVQNKILNVKAFPEYFPNKELFLEEISDWLSYGEDSS